MVKTRVHTLIVIEADGTTYEEGFDYSGPVALCKGGGGTQVTYPGPSAQELQLMEEQTSLLRLQTQQSKQQAGVQEMLAPYVYKQLGLTPTYSEPPKYTGEQTTSAQKTMSELGSIVKALDSGAKSGPGWEIASSGALFYQDPNTGKRRTTTAGGIRGEYENAKQTLNPTGDITGFQQGLKPGEITGERAAELGNIFEKGFGEGKSITDIAGEQKMSSEEMEGYLNTLAWERSMKALLGQLPVDPALQHELDLQKQELQETMRKRLGPGWQESSAGMEALDKFSRRSSDIMQSYRQGELTTSESLRLAGDQSMAGKQQQTFGQLMGSRGYPYGGVDYLSTAQGYSSPLGYGQNERQNQMQAGIVNAQIAMQNKAQSQNSLWRGIGTVGQLGLGLLGMF